jgi:hypothetical protein
MGGKRYGDNQLRYTERSISVFGLSRRKHAVSTNMAGLQTDISFLSLLLSKWCCINVRLDGSTVHLTVAMLDVLPE